MNDPRDHSRRAFIKTASATVGSGLVAACGGGASDGAGSAVAAPVGNPPNPASQPPAVPPGAGAAPPAAPQPPAPVQPGLVSPVKPLADPGRARFTLRSAQAVSNHPYSLALPLLQGEFPNGTVPVAADGRAVQATIKNRWPDGSAKIALLAGRATLAAGATQAVELASSATAAPAGPVLTEAELLASGFDATVSFGAKGSVSLRSLLGKAATRGADGRWAGGRVRAWVQGPLMSSWTYMAMLGSDAHLAAWFEVRYFGGTDVHVLAWLENGFLKTPGCTGHIERLSLALQGTTVFSADVHLANHCRVVAQDGPGVGYLRGVSSAIDVHYPGLYLQATGLFPAYLVSIDPAGSYARGLTRSYSPATFGQVPIRVAGVNYSGNYSPGMGNAGYHGSIGLVPEWDAVFVASGGDADCARAVFANALGAGRYSIHDRDETTLQPIILSQYPTLSITRTGRSVTDIGGSSIGEFTPAATYAVNGAGVSRQPEVWATSHHPSIGYAAYLLSGFSFFIETSQFAAALNFLKQSDVNRQRTAGIMLTYAGSNTTRGAAWALRTLAQAACISPDGDPVGEAMKASVGANLDFYFASNIQSPGNPLGVCPPYSNYTPGETPPRFSHAMWMEDFLTATWGWIIQMRIVSQPAQQGRLTEFFEWKARAAVGRLGVLDDATQFGYNSAAPYTLAIAPVNGGQAPAPGQPLWYANWGEAFQATYGRSNAGNRDTNLLGGNYPDATSYWGNLMPAISYAVEAGVPGAVEAYARMTSAPNWSLFLQSAGSAPVWAVRPRNPGGVYS